jgi:voltage-gated potassium channel
MRKALIISGLFALLLFGGTLGYMLFENTGFWDGMYLTIITIFTVGYGDMVPIYPAGKVFTVILVVTSVSFVMYTFSKITETVIEGELRGIFRRRRMNKSIERLKDHYIVCGYGRIGKEICRILHEYGRPFVVIEKNVEEIQNIEDAGYLEYLGEASDDDVLLGVGIKRAKGLITVVSTDADNLYVTLTARGLNPDLYIMARSSGESGVRTKLLRAGATKVISPYSLGARRMAHLIVRPTVTDFIDLTMQAGDLGLTMDELRAGQQSPLAGKTLIEAEIRKRYDIIVVAIKREDGTMLFNPKPDAQILAGDTLIVLGTTDSVVGLQQELG